MTPNLTPRKTERLASPRPQPRLRYTAPSRRIEQDLNSVCPVYEHRPVSILSHAPRAADKLRNTDPQIPSIEEPSITKNGNCFLPADLKH
jgi:hypothetical protein